MKKVKLLSVFDSRESPKTTIKNFLCFHLYGILVVVPLSLLKLNVTVYLHFKVELKFASNFYFRYKVKKQKHIFPFENGNKTQFNNPSSIESKCILLFKNKNEICISVIK